MAEINYKMDRINIHLREKQISELGERIEVTKSELHRGGGKKTVSGTCGIR